MQNNNNNQLPQQNNYGHFQIFDPIYYPLQIEQQFPFNNNNNNFFPLQYPLDNNLYNSFQFQQQQIPIYNTNYFQNYNTTAPILNNFQPYAGFNNDLIPQQFGGMVFFFFAKSLVFMPNTFFSIII